MNKTGRVEECGRQQKLHVGNRCVGDYEKEYDLVMPVSSTAFIRISEYTSM